ncbi:MAG TPA: YetF domain-containing protein [Acidobacteriaceae bacterium]|nr:YetF domain-containing protein [Acidobacteriaceae bacterium]
MKGLFADGWDPIIRIVVIGSLSYFAVVALLRYFGKRALTKMNAFDLVVTVAVGSAFASAVTSKNVSLADGVAAFVVLLVLQRSFAALSIHIGWFGRYLKAQPLLIIYRGVILWDAARKEQLGDLEILGGLRSKGIAAVEDVLAMVLEPDGSFSVIPMSAAQGTKLPTALQDVRGVPEFDAEANPATKRKVPNALPE